MQYIRKTALSLAVSLLFTVLLLFGITLGLQRVFGTPDALKHALKDSGFYQNVVGNALDQSQKQETAGEGDKIPVDQPEVRNIIKDAASPELLQTQLEQALDSVYLWMQGKTSTLAFTIDAGDIKARLADGIEQYATQHLASLPVCPSTTLPIGDIDPFNATCLPQGVSANQAAAEAKNQVLNGEFLKNTTVSADTIKTDGGNTLEQQLSAVPVVYQAINWAAYGAGLLSALLAVAVVFLSQNWRSGLKKLSITFISIGVISALLGWLASLGTQRGAEFAQEPLQQSAIKAAQFLVNDLRTWWMGYGITLIVFGIATLVTLRFTKPSASDEAKKLAQQPTGEAVPATTAVANMSEPAKPLNEQNSKPVKKLIQ